jgi:hypothetical protein
MTTRHRIDQLFEDDGEEVDAALEAAYEALIDDAVDIAVDQADEVGFKVRRVTELIRGSVAALVDEWAKGKLSGEQRTHLTAWLVDDAAEAACDMDM